jgi:hypothetical protein
LSLIVFYVITTVAATQTFSYTGSYQLFHVPRDVSNITVEACGANGGGYWKQGGKGGCITCTISVKPLETLYFYVGGYALSSDGGYNGWSSFSSGGGATDVRQNGSALENRNSNFNIN